MTRHQMVAAAKMLKIEHKPNIPGVKLLGLIKEATDKLNKDASAGYECYPKNTTAINHLADKVQHREFQGAQIELPSSFVEGVFTYNTSPECRSLLLPKVNKGIHPITGKPVE